VKAVLEDATPPEVPPVEVRPEDPSPMQPPFAPGVGRGKLGLTHRGGPGFPIPRCRTQRLPGAGCQLFSETVGGRHMAVVPVCRGFRHR
jgi:hypothetical protein